MCDVLHPTAPACDLPPPSSRSDEINPHATQLTGSDDQASSSEPVTFKCGYSDGDDNADSIDCENRHKPWGSKSSDTHDGSYESIPIRCEDRRVRKCSAPNMPIIPRTTSGDERGTLENAQSDRGISDQQRATWSNTNNDTQRNDQLRSTIDCPPSGVHLNSTVSSPVSYISVDNTTSSSFESPPRHLKSTMSSVEFGSTLYPAVQLTPISSRSSSRRLSVWYSSLGTSYKNKVDQFRRIFRGTPVDTDRLLVDYSCALSKNNHGLLLQGRMYVTENWVCFHSKILYEQKIFLAVKEIIGITKEKTARLIPNAIQIIYSKNHQRFFFTSFASRERSFAILRKVWENCRSHQAMTVEEIMQQVREIYGDDSLAMLEDEDTDGDAGSNLEKPRLRITSDSSDANHTDTGDVVGGQPTPEEATWSTALSNQPTPSTGSHPPMMTTDEAEFHDDEDQGIEGRRVSNSQNRWLAAGDDMMEEEEDEEGGGGGDDNDENEDDDTQQQQRLSDSQLVPRNRRRCRTPDDSTTHLVVRGKNGPNREQTYAIPRSLPETHSTSQLSIHSDRKRRSKKRHHHHHQRTSAGATNESVKPDAPESTATSGYRPVVLPVFPEDATSDMTPSVNCRPGHDHPGQMYVNTLIPLSVDALFACIFTDSQFFDDLSAARGTFNMVQALWPAVHWPLTNSTEKEGHVNHETEVERTIGYTLSLKQRLGPRTCAAVEKQTLLVTESQPGRCYVIDAKVTNQAVPLCNCFCVVSRYCLLRVDRLSCRLCISSRVVYEKPVFFGAKSIIENTCRSGLTDFFTALTAQLTEMASRLTDEDRLTGGVLSAPSTSKMIVHEKHPTNTNSSAEGGGAKNKKNSTVSSGSVREREKRSGERRRSDSRKVASTGGVKGNDKQPDGQMVGSNLNSSSSSTPTHKMSGKPYLTQPSSTVISSGYNGQNKTIFLRPDRAWLLLVCMSLLLCICLSMVYNRLVALEELAKQLSSPSSDATFGSASVPLDHQFNSIHGIHPSTSDMPRVEIPHGKLQAMKRLTRTMSETLSQVSC